MDEFDVVVIGAGPAGEVAAGRCSDGGLRVALVEQQLVGGECSYWGCIPSKTLLRPGEAIRAAREAPGANAGPVDAAAALAWRDFMVSGYDDARQADWLESKRAEPVRGAGRHAKRAAVLRGPGGIAGPVVVAVGGRRYTTEHIVVAPGSDAVIPPIPGL